MRITQVLYSLAIGGSEVLGKNIAIALKNQGFFSSVCTIEQGGELEEELRRKDIPYYIVDKKPGEFLRSMWRVFKFFLSLRPDIVHTHHLYMLIYSLIPAKVVGAKVVHTEHEYFSLQSYKNKRILSFLSRFCDKLTAVEEDVMIFLRDTVGISAEKLVTISNGVDFGILGRHSTLSRQTFGLGERDPVIGIVARLEPVKDHETLLKAVARIQKMQTVSLLIVGDGTMRRPLEQLAVELRISERVCFTGVRRNIPDLLQLMDIFVLCSSEEGLPMALLEAMAAGKPVVSTKVGSIPKLIIDGVNGLLVEKKDHEGLAGALERLIFNPSLSQRIGQAAQDTVAKNYSFAKTIEAYMSVYTQCLKNKG